MTYPLHLVMAACGVPSNEQTDFKHIKDFPEDKICGHVAMDRTHVYCSSEC